MLRGISAIVRVCVVAGLAALTAACAGSQPRIPYTAQEAALAQPPGYEHIRVWLDEARDYPVDFAPDLKPGEASQYLALSGGGGNGAYGAGILNGWTQSGRRPTFNAVSGVSTGALMAPFAFLGPAYDATLADIYTGGEAETLVAAPDFGRAAFGSSLFGGHRLLDLVSRYVTPDIVEAIAREHRAGRRLYVVTTNIDSKRGVVWNIGAIAASGRPDSIDLIRKVLAASASVPLVFAPQLIEVTADGREFQEMHADGNVTTAVFTLPLKYLALQRKTRLAGGSIYVVMNTVIEPQFSVVERSTLPIVAASIDTLTTQKSEVDLAQMYAYAKANKVDFNLTSIDPAIVKAGLGSFDTAYMRRLYDAGVETGRTGGFWRKAPLPSLPPPNTAPEESVAVARRGVPRAARS
ncbi:Alpha/beta hydrolase [Beijerinckiaceae bacterium RH AL1]|nr:patatin-like phospholipase family protein [Beijerinckiaceae bacterium]VVB48269.1 Alpha/beta hydrolase [Beijerinckiaceae bacterium RH CH11]VVB48350.1 Alpha/beta hydrolase [Beijerinckiaceae bacterium RH AL8]VVC56309.1 Alpha/beta hydrolase [Beijerinckiaceae bacterium RH AL1]